MRALIWILLAVFATLAAGCGGGVNCSDKHPGPGCWEADQKRQRKNREEQISDCKDRGLAFADGAAQALGCDDKIHHCERADDQSFGCPAGWGCGVDDARVCFPLDADAFAPPNPIPSYCMRCANRKLMGEQQARAAADAAEHTKRMALEQTVSDGEVQSGSCSPARKAALTKALGEVERAQQKYAFASAKRGELVATAEGAPLDIAITADGDFLIVAVSTLAIEVDTPGSRSGGPHAFPHVGKLYTMTDNSLMQKDGLQQRLLVKGHGCTLWSVMLRK